MTEKIWNHTHSNWKRYHAFDSGLRALCNRRIYSRGAGTQGGKLVGHDQLKTRAEAEAFQFAEFCARCESQLS